MFLHTYFKRFVTLIYIQNNRGYNMARAHNKVEKLLRDIEEMPENADMILEIARKEYLDFKWVCKTVFHHKNFDTPKKCRIMEDIVYGLVLLGMNTHMNDSALYTAARCMMPVEAKEASRVKYKKIDSEEKRVMHTDRAFTLIRVFDRLEKDGIYLFGVPKHEKPDPLAEIQLRKLRRRIIKNYEIAGLEPPAAFRTKRMPHKDKVRRQLRHVA